jgi:ligand-binding SRPBCC domain-containing protein
VGESAGPRSSNAPAKEGSVVEIARDTAERGAWVLRTSMTLPRARADVFSFFADASNLETITPAVLRFRILTPTPVEMRAGALIDYRLRIRGMPVRWRTEIAAWEPPVRFVDRQLRGPYRQWVHEHRFTETDEGTLCEDVVRYRAPGGGLVHRWLVAPDLRRIFEYRAATMRRLFDGPTAPARSPVASCSR